MIINRIVSHAIYLLRILSRLGSFAAADSAIFDSCPVANAREAGLLYIVNLINE